MKNHKKHITQEWKKQDIRWLIAGVLAIGMFFGVALACTVALVDCAEAEDAIVYPCWVICQPDRQGNPGEVMIRERPGKGSAAAGAAVAGRMYWTDWQDEDGWIHLVDLSNESGEGWVYMGYVVFNEPEAVNAAGVITGGGRVACRKCIDGKRKAWAAEGSQVMVYWMSAEWCVTDRGYINTEYLVMEE